MVKMGEHVLCIGMLESAAVSSMITSKIVDKLELQGVPEKDSISTVTQRSSQQGKAVRASHCITP